MKSALGRVRWVGKTRRMWPFEAANADAVVPAGVVGVDFPKLPGKDTFNY